MPSPTVRGRRVRAELARLRKERDLTITHVAGELDWSPSRLSRIESGHRQIHPTDVRVLLDVYEVTGPQRDALIQLARESRKKAWWHSYGDAVPEWFETYVGLEAEASRIHVYESELVPGLLQTEQYARALHEVSLVEQPEEEIEKRVKVRMTRQDRLTAPDAPQLWAIVNEAVLRRVVGDAATMREQLDHLHEAAKRRNITLQILPFGVGAHPAMDGAFNILDFPEEIDPTVVYLDTRTGGLYLEEPEHVNTYRLMFNHVVARALAPEESSAFLARVVAEL
ncbi:MAG: helix-turn-helix domain-containing protein [Streptosporangiales bacterium]|nr:helix-turn-helix domain-containing protein [Streptosporangiales bacterium]